MSIEYIEQLITHLRTFQSQVESRTTDADHLRNQVEILKAQLEAEAGKMEDLRNRYDTLLALAAAKDAEISNLQSQVSTSEQRNQTEKNRYGQLKARSDTLQNQLDVIKSVFNGLAFEYYRKATEQAMSKTT